MGDLTLRDDDGDRVEGSAVFLAGFAHGLNPPTRAPDPLPEFELRRTGQAVRLEPDDAPVPLTISWHQPGSSDPPVAIDYGTGSLPIPVPK